MAVATRSLFVVCSRRAWWIAPTAALFLLSAGCKHHQRYAMRPAYGAPVIVEPGSCPPGASVPAFGDDGLTPPAPSLLPPADSSVVPGRNEEPQLEPSTVAPEATPGNDGPTLEAPKTSRRTTRPAPPSTRRATLRTRVAQFVNDPNDLFQPPRADRPWRYIVLHHSAQPDGSYAEIDREHRAKIGTAGCGYHFVIGNGTGSPDGQIEVAQRWADQRGGAHCRDAKSPDVNDYGIGICLVGNLDASGPTPRQIEAARALVAYLRDRYDIPAQDVDTHAHLARNPTVCPGKNFPAEAILNQSSVAARW
jgi:hypothetical protein